MSSRIDTPWQAGECNEPAPPRILFAFGVDPRLCLQRILLLHDRVVDFLRGLGARQGLPEAVDRHEAADARQGVDVRAGLIRRAGEEPDQAYRPAIDRLEIDRGLRAPDRHDEVVGAVALAVRD